MISLRRLSRRRALSAIAAGLAGAHRPITAAAAPTRLAIGGTGAALGTIRRLAEAFRAANPAVDLELPPSLGTTGGMRAVMSGAIDIAVSVRPETPEEAAAGARSLHFARSPFGFVTSLRQPPTDLTSRDIVDIYALKRRHWPDGSPIRLILRTRRDGDSLFIVERFPAAEAVLDETHAKQTVPVAQTDQTNLDLAEKLEGSFASSTMAAVVSEGRNLRPLVLDGVPPTLEAVASGAYPHVRPLYLVTTPRAGEAARAFLDFVRSVEAGAIMRACACAPMAG